MPRGHRLEFPSYGIFSPFFNVWFIQSCFILANSADPEEITHSAAFQLGLHCLSNAPDLIAMPQNNCPESPVNSL